MTHYCYWVKGKEFSDMAALSMQTVRRVDPKAKFMVFTDDPKHTPRIDARDVAWYEIPEGRPAMVANLDAQIAALHCCQRGDQLLFLDADIVMRRPFPFALLPDLYVTYRHEVTSVRNGEVKEADPDAVMLQPYNYGVVGCHVRPQIIEAFYWLRARVLAMNMRNQLWFGNQLALAELVGVAPKEEQDKLVRIRWSPLDSGTELKVRQLPCTVWNYSPNSKDEDVSAKGILHMKGERKDLMKHYAEVA
jgi:hypothetical protein